MSIATEINRISNEVDTQSDLLDQALELISEKSAGDTSSEAQQTPKYGTAVVFGDSLANTGSGSFVDLLVGAGRFTEIKNFAVANTTIGPYHESSTQNALCFYNKVSGLTEGSDDHTSVANADFIFITYSSNDLNYVASNKVGLGTVNDEYSESSTTNSVCAYLSETLRLLRVINPTARIVFIAPTRWKMPGSIVGVPTAVKNAYGANTENMLILMEATLYRVVEKYSGHVIDAFAGFDILAHLHTDNLHPSESGHYLIADNVMANLESNTIYPHLVKEVVFTTNDGVNYTTAENWSAVKTMLDAGYVDIHGVGLLVDGSHARFTCAGYSSAQILFSGEITSGGSLIRVGLVWTSAGAQIIQIGNSATAN